MEYKGYKIESIKNDGHLQRVAFGIYKNGKLISTATTSKEAQHEVDNIVNRPVTIEYIIVNKKNDSKTRETIKATESDVDKKIKELERKYSNDKTYYLRDVRKVRDMKAIDKLDKAIKALDEFIYVDVSEWQRANGLKMPSGYGTWWFKIGNEKKSFSGKYSDAKAMAMKYAKEKRVTTIRVLS